MNIKPEWKKEIETAKAEATANLQSHENTENIHRTIYVSTASPLNTQGKDGDIWITYEA